MNLLFFGSSDFSVPALESLRPLITCVVTRKAKPKGRGYLLEGNEVRRAALGLGLPLREIGSFRDEEAKELGETKPDLLVTVSFGLIIPGWFLDIPSIGAINVHPSLLPKYRGPSPLQWAVWNGEKETGITIIRMERKMDAGAILYQEKSPIGPDEDAAALSARLASRSAEILPPLVEKAQTEGLLPGTPQNDDEATYTPMITKEMGRIDWSLSAMEIARQVRALVSWPTAATSLDGKVLKVFKVREPAAPYPHEAEAGTVVALTPDGIEVVCGAGSLMLEEVQIENRKRMAAAIFARGYRGLVGKRLV
jgi:methionyl-tRNA formyltransferase